MSRTEKNTARGLDEVLELTVDDPAHGGACVARDPSSRVVFVRHALPGERVRARITSAQKRLAWADAIEILDASEDRVESVWPQAGPGGVGGGELAHVAPAAQRTWKAHVVASQLRRIAGESLSQEVANLGGVQVQAAPGDEDPSDPLTHRRSRIELVIDANGHAGMHRFRSSEVVALDAMPLAVESISALGLFDAHSPLARLWRPGDRLRVVAPNGQDPVLVTPRGVFCADGQPLAAEVLHWDVGTRMRGTFRYGVSPSGFWQTHIRGAEALLDSVDRASHVENGASVVELYSGAGLFTRLFAERVGDSGEVVSLEGAEEAVRNAGDTLARFPAVSTFHGQVDRLGVAELGAQLRSTRPDVVVMDPPRSGAGRGVCEAVAELGAERIVLVSCDPAAGARDLRTLAEAGYRVASFEAWDLFPHTHHVETVAELLRD
ncbi:TRAM domain-containing protein [Schaalia sp. ZJ1691]|uniref:class I SAM-dependent RNA methyltransferase n=1 Tax=Schaalia sp. ZJ1691 TaxID=2709404 RepID=UPI001F14CDC7|nr:TRAM domain-containing protein [Schaalia sp. ZJ1691]